MNIKKDTHVEVDACEIIEALKLKGTPSDFSMTRTGNTTVIRFRLTE